MAEVDRKHIQEKKFKATLVAFTCCRHIAFSIVESPWFTALLSAFSNLVAELAPLSQYRMKVDDCEFQDK